MGMRRFTRLANALSKKGGEPGARGVAALLDRTDDRDYACLRHPT